MANTPGPSKERGPDRVEGRAVVRHVVWARSGSCWLPGLGRHAARQSNAVRLTEARPSFRLGSSELPDPCLHGGRRAAVPAGDRRPSRSPGALSAIHHARCPEEPPWTPPPLIL